MTFLERFAPWSDEQKEAAARALRLVQEQGLEVVRIAFADQHGLLRGKTLMAGEMAGALHNGCSITSSLFAKDTANRTVFPVWTAGGGFGLDAFEGAGDVLMIPDPSTFRVLPWASRTGWLLADVYLPDGRPVPYATRHIYRTALSRLAEAGYDYVAGLEVEFHVFKCETDRMAPEESGQPGAPPRVSILTHGYQYLSELRFDQIEPVLEIIRRDVVALGLPLRSVECEYGPSQCEFTFQALSGLEPADTMVLFRSAVKQICRRHGLHATFMCRPRIPNVMSSGWHLHQSLVDRKSGTNAFMPERQGELLSALGRHFLAGLLTHARASAVFATPTLNGYKRFRPHSLAPDRAVWGHDNRGVWCACWAAPVIGQRGSRTGSGSPPPTLTSTWPRRCSPGSTASPAASIPVPRPMHLTRPRPSCCPKAWPRRCRRCAAMRSSARHWALPSSTTC